MEVCIGLTNRFGAQPHLIQSGSGQETLECVCIFGYVCFATSRYWFWDITSVNHILLVVLHSKSSTLTDMSAAPTEASVSEASETLAHESDLYFAKEDSCSQMILSRGRCRIMETKKRSL